MTARLIQVTLAAVCRLGDSTVSSTKGISLAAAGAANSILTIGPITTGSQGDASQFYLFGTASDVIDVLLV